MKREKVDLLWLLGVAVTSVFALCLINRGYGFHRDELATLDDARHLAFGYVAYPPVTPFFGWLSLHLFGESLPGFRFFAAVAISVAAVLTGLMARALGGGRGAQLLAACATLPLGLVAGSLMQYVAFDYLCWVAVAYGFVRLIESNDERRWVAIGAAIGLGMLTKYSMVFCVAGLAVAFVWSGRWRDLRTRWFWIGAGLSLLLFLPNLLWQVQHHFISLDFLRHIHERDVRIGRTKDFLPDQLKLTLFLAPLALAGLWFFFGSKSGHRFRSLGFFYLVPLLLFVVARGRGYYLAPAYPLLYAGGSVWLEQKAAKSTAWWRRSVWSLGGAAVAAFLAVVCMLVLPLAPVGTAWWKKALQTNGDLREEFGWPELAETVAKIRDGIPIDQRARLGILVGNYGEGGAINLYGPRFGLPAAISGVNSFWERGYGDPPSETVIALGLSREFLERNFTECELAGYIENKENVANEETTDHREMFICRGLRRSWPDFWKDFRHYG